jgi:hypothetical protein
LALIVNLKKCFEAVVKYYFLLGYGAGLHTENPDWIATKTWHKDLQKACDGLIEEQTKERERKSEKLPRL